MKVCKGQPDLRSALFGGRGEVRVWNLLPEHAEPFTAVLSCELSAAGSVGRHVQQDFAEIVIGLDGEGSATVDGRVHPLHAGDVIYLPLGSVLAIENLASAQPLRYLIVKARG